MASPSDEVAVICLQLMVPAVVFLVLVLLFIFLLYFFAKYYMGSRSSLFTFSSPRNQQLIPISNHGLTPQLLASLPITVFTPSMYKEGLECSVCLDQLSEGEKLRTLLKCSHAFHVNCIDMWFQSHTTCPLCRTAVITEEVVEPEEVCVGGVSTELSEIPTNVLFWGNQDGVSNGVASTQVASDEEGSSSSSSLYPKEMEEMKAPRSGRLRSFRRLLSRGKMVADVGRVGVV